MSNRGTKTRDIHPTTQNRWDVSGWLHRPSNQRLVPVKWSHFISCLQPEINANRGEMMGRPGRMGASVGQGANTRDREARPKASQTSFKAASPSHADKGDRRGESPPDPVRDTRPERGSREGRTPLPATPEPHTAENGRPGHVLCQPRMTMDSGQSAEEAMCVLVQTKQVHLGWPRAQGHSCGQKRRQMWAPEPSVESDFLPPGLLCQSPCPVTAGGNEAPRPVSLAHSQRLQRTKSPGCHCLPGSAKTDGPL